MRTKRALWVCLVVLAALWAGTASPVRAQADAPHAVVLTIDGPITQIMADYLARGLSIAHAQQADFVIILLDTPGGMVETMNNIIQQIRRSDIPIIVYVAPQNAMAGSAGTLITLAGHASAMAPQTTIGAAAPVGGVGEDIGEAMERKTKEILRATIRTLAQHRPPEAIALAEETIETARAVTVDEALAVGLIDIKAVSIDDLLVQLDGRTVMLNDQQFVLRTAGASTQEVPYTFIEQVLMMLINPNLVFLLLAIGVQAILIELSNPGGWVAGFIGAVCLLLAFYGFGALPVNWFGIIFIIIAFVLFILELTTPTTGFLAVAGVISFISGALILFNTAEVPGFPPVSIPLVVGTGIFMGVTFLAAAAFALRTRNIPVQMGVEAIRGKVGIVHAALNPRGTVSLLGEEWSAELIEGAGPAREGEPVEVIRVDGLTLKVRRVS
ncbi:MAG: nodulation protein NfeD [Anaerolineaceae bacterium]|jgi:membrane-bound serine protease (ClpP class)